MEKAVLISIRPEWCERIASGEKTVEVRKTRPKLKTPFKCYIYCTKPKGKYGFGLCRDDDRVGLVNACNYEYAQKHSVGILSGKVIGEFVCKGTPAYWTSNPEDFEELCAKGRMSVDDLYEYAEDREWIFGWHISNLVIYDKPKELSEFCKTGTLNAMDFEYQLYDGGGSPGRRSYASYLFTRAIRKPPQSWCYVEPITT